MTSKPENYKIEMFPYLNDVISQLHVLSSLAKF